ncbi:nuclear transport factor 2 family protein [Leucobacter sp. M11]|uniref:nuclear transport factor 2 family protein n=1 Tax=Leucobacter sp. M11 TaxID=2993565 RepID=UPI002D7E492C|nr:DUF4440 domain-containing protein [Leucobacter sp. M11]MEB4615031.1 DUF4440 domain-containing protein [Leucobacter sp. M11]
MTEASSETTGTEDLAAAALRGEQDLLDPRVRGDAERMVALLHPEFREFGRSGRVWDTNALLSDLRAGSDYPFERARLSEPVTEVLGPDAVLLTYLLHDTDGVTRRSSIWRRTPDGVRLYFHQGTRASL